MNEIVIIRYIHLRNKRGELHGIIYFAVQLTAYNIMNVDMKQFNKNIIQD